MEQKVGFFKEKVQIRNSSSKGDQVGSKPHHVEWKKKPRILNQKLRIQSSLRPVKDLYLVSRKTNKWERLGDVDVNEYLTTWRRVNRVQLQQEWGFVLSNEWANRAVVAFLLDCFVALLCGNNVTRNTTLADNESYQSKYILISEWAKS